MTPLESWIGKGRLSRIARVVALRLRFVLCGVVAAWSSVSTSGATETVTVAFGAEPVQIDPTRSAAGVDSYFFSLFYEQLLITDPDLKQRNWLADDWQVIESPEAVRIRVRLRRGVKFHNGQPLTSDDLRYAYERQSAPGSPVARNVRYVSAIEIIDDHNFDIVLSQPDGSLITGNLALWVIPREHFETVGDDGVQAEPVGTGPWKFVSRKVRDEIVLERFEDYWNKDHMPRAKRLIIKLIPEDTTRVAAFKTGAVDWIDAVPPAQVESLKSEPGVRIASLPAPNNLYISTNNIDPGSPFRDRRVRQAVAQGVDVDAIVKYILHGQGIRTAQLAPGSIGYDPSLTPYPYDPEQSRRLLAQAGFEAGISTNCYNLTTPREPYIKEVGETIYAYLAEVGIRCRIVQMEYGAWINLARRAARPHMDGILSTMWGQGLPGDPTDAWSGHLHTTEDDWGTYSYHADPEFDRLIVELRSLLHEPERAQKIKEIARLKHAQLAGGIPTYRPMLTLAWRDSLHFVPWPQAFWRAMREIGPAALTPLTRRTPAPQANP